LKDFKLPIGIMGLAIPLGALAAAIHRSVQTSRQIIEQNQQNIFSNYLEHRRYFLAYMEEHQPFEQISVSAPLLYQRLFPNSAEGALNPNEESIAHFLEVAEGTADTAAQRVETQLTERRFKIIDDELAAFLIGSTKALQQFVSIENLDEKEFLKDPLTILPRILRQNLDAAKGLVESANFHKNYVKQYDFDEMEKKTQACLDAIKPIQKLYNLWRMIWGEVSGELQSNPHQPLQNRLSSVKQNMESNRMTTNDLRIIFKYHLNDNERTTILEHGPDMWRAILADTKSGGDN
jgi:hypothetical protein